MTDDDLVARQVLLIADPHVGKVVGGTGGLRKVRFAKRGANRGKSGSYRIGYTYFEAVGVIGLLVVYAKSDQSDVPPAQRA